VRALACTPARHEPCEVSLQVCAINLVEGSFIEGADADLELSA